MGIGKLVSSLYLGLSVFSTGCGFFGGIHVETVSSAASAPGNVAVYLTASDKDKRALQLSEENFRLEEDGKPLDPQQVQLRLLPRELAVEHDALVLVDLSGPIEDRGARKLLTSQLIPFVDRLRLQQAVSVFGFDGASDLMALGRYPRLTKGQTDGRESAPGLTHLTELKQRDPSSNLNGALIAAIHDLSAQQSRSAKPVRIGSIIVIARGPDLAGRANENAVFDTLHQTTHHLYAVTIGKDTELAERIGESGYARAGRFENIESALADVAAKVENDFNRYYLVSYCSPARSGRRELTLLVERTNRDGEKQAAKLHTEFDASGFRSGCDSSAPPRFTLTPTQPKTEAAEGTAAGAETAAPAEPDVEAAPPPEGGNYAL